MRDAQVGRLDQMLGGPEHLVGQSAELSVATGQEVQQRQIVLETEADRDALRSAFRRFELRQAGVALDQRVGGLADRRQCTGDVVAGTSSSQWIVTNGEELPEAFSALTPGPGH